jgi:hypothetical protein
MQKPIHEASSLSRSQHKYRILPTREVRPTSDSPSGRSHKTIRTLVLTPHPIYPSSAPPTRTEILRGNGDTSELVIGGTAPRPCSEDVCVSITRRLFDNVAARFWLNCCRSYRPVRGEVSNDFNGPCRDRNGVMDVSVPFSDFG